MKRAALQECIRVGQRGKVERHSRILASLTKGVKDASSQVADRSAVFDFLVDVTHGPASTISKRGAGPKEREKERAQYFWGESASLRQTNKKILCTSACFATPLVFEVNCEF